MNYSVKRIVSLAFECICGWCCSSGKNDSILTPASLIPSRIAHLITKYQNRPVSAMTTALNKIRRIEVAIGIGGMLAIPLDCWSDCGIAS